MWSLALQNCKMVGVMAPIPLAATLAVCVPSIAARASPKYILEGVVCLE